MDVTDPERHQILRTNGEMAVVLAAKLPALLRDERISTEKLDDFLVAVSSRCMEIEQLLATRTYFRQSRFTAL